jgi:hypothetical protein
VEVGRLISDRGGGDKLESLIFAIVCPSSADTIHFSALAFFSDGAL